MCIVYGVSYGASRPEELGNNLARLEEDVIPAVVRGDIRPIIDTTLPWTSHQEAASRLLDPSAQGKIVLAINKA